MDLRMMARIPLRPRSSKGGGVGDSNGAKSDKGYNNDLPTADWDKAWSSFKKSAVGSKKWKKAVMFNPNKYVSWNPRRSEFPAEEEVNPIKRTERSTLGAWTSPEFTLVGAAIIVSLLLLYTLVFPPLPK